VRNGNNPRAKEITMPPAKSKKQSQPLQDSATLIVTLGDGTTREFLYAAMMLDEHANLLIVRVLDPPKDPVLTIVYAPGVWNSVERLPRLPSEANTY
jgi:hypothetical protein